MSDLKLCYGCMEPLDGDSVCPHCGYDRNTTSLANYLKPGTMLRERFLVGKALDSNGEGVTYIGYDTAVGCKILIREYMPEQLCSRVPNSTEINVNYEHLAQYKALMAEYTELNKALARLRNLSHLNPALDLFTENNTTYAVYEYLEGQTLLDYLKDNAGELSWNIVRRIFPPLFTTLSLLHNAGVLHRGLSPETIYVTDKGELKLRGFCISAVRTNDTELDAELFDGYAAPEQYFADRQQGTWTDVYGICAVLYRILTGSRASDAISRQDYDNLVPPIELNPHMPENVSKGIMQGLALEGSERVRTITDLVTLLFDESANEENTSGEKGGTTAVFPAQNDIRQAGAGAAAAAGAARHHAAQRPARNGSAQPAARPGARPAQGARNGAARPGTQRGNTGRTPVPRNGQRPGQRPGQQHPGMGGRPGAGTRNAAMRSGMPAQRTRNGSMTQNGAARRRPSAAAANSRNRKAQEATVFEKIRAPLLIAFLFIAIVTVVILAFVKLIGSNSSSPSLANRGNSSESDNVIPAATDVTDLNAHVEYGVVPQLVGRNFTLKHDEMASSGWLYLEPVYEFSDSIIKDTIMEQELSAGEEFVIGSTMKVKVSLGPSLITIPPYKGTRLNAYLNQLKEMGLVEAIDGDGGSPAGQTQKGGKQTTTAAVDVPVNENGKRQVVMYRAKVDYNYSNGYVCAVSPAAGKVIDALDDYEIIVYYAYNPVYQTISNGTTGTGSSTTKTGKTTGTTTATTAKPTQTQAPQTQAPQTQAPQTQAPQTQAPPPQTDLPPQPPAVSDPPADDQNPA